MNAATKLKAEPHCARCAPHLHEEADDFPGKCELDSPTLKEDAANLIAAFDKHSNIPPFLADALARAKRQTDHADQLDTLLSAIANHCEGGKESVPVTVADAYNTASYHFGLVKHDEPNWPLFPGAEKRAKRA